MLPKTESAAMHAGEKTFVLVTEFGEAGSVIRFR